MQLLDVETADWALKTYDLEARRYKGGDALVAVEGKDQVRISRERCVRVR